MAQGIRRFARNETAATAIEYSLMASLIALAVISVVSGIGLKLSGYLSEVSSAMK